MPRRPKVPELMGTYEVAQALGTQSSNVHPKAQVGLPEPITRVKATRLWLASEIETFVKEREARGRPDWNAARQGRGDEKQG